MKYVLRMILGWLLVLNLVAILSPEAALAWVWVTALAISFGLFLCSAIDVGEL